MNYNLTTIQSDRLSELLTQLQAGQNTVWEEAFDSSMMSDAKSAIYGIQYKLETDNILPESIKQELAALASKAWSEIRSLEKTTTERVQNSHAVLAKAEQKIVDILQYLAEAN